MPVVIDDATAAALLLFLGNCDCEANGDPASVIAQELLYRCIDSLRGGGLGHPPLSQRTPRHSLTPPSSPTYYRGPLSSPHPHRQRLPSPVEGALEGEVPASQDGVVSDGLKVEVSGDVLA